jgi:PAS domain S-box-containing protein
MNVPHSTSLASLPRQIQWLVVIALCAVLLPAGGYLLFLRHVELDARLFQGEMLESINTSHDAMTTLDELILVQTLRRAADAPGTSASREWSRRELSLFVRLKDSASTLIGGTRIRPSEETLALLRRLRVQLVETAAARQKRESTTTLRARLEAIRLTLDQNRLLQTEAYTREERSLDALQRRAFWLAVPLITGLGLAGAVLCLRIFRSITGAIGHDRRTRDALAHSEERSRSLITHAPYCIHELDIAGRFLSINSAGVAMLGISDGAALIGRPFLDMVGEADRGRIGSLLTRAWHGETPQFEFTSVNARRFLCNLVPLSGPGARIDRVIGMGMDITEREAVAAAIRRALDEKEMLLREIHHRVKNNLQTISSLLHFQSKKLAGPEALAVFNQARERLASMILVHEKLYSSGNLSSVDFADYVRSLADQMSQSHQRSDRHVGLRIEAAPLHLPIESALPAGMILVELITNAYKYAFPEERGGEVVIRLESDRDRVSLTVGDNGVGLPPGFDPCNTGSFGWQLITNLTAQLDGECAIERNGGTSVRISFTCETTTP